MSKKKITYSQVGDNYETKDPIKKLAQDSASKTGRNLMHHGFSEVSDSRGESAYVWSLNSSRDKKQGSVFMASVIEGLGTKNLVADLCRTKRKTYYDIIGHDTVATIINDLVSVGATPLVVHAYWAVEDNSWLEDKERMKDLITGWKDACDLAGASWGGGETPTMKGIMQPGTIELGGSAVGIIQKEKHLLSDKRLVAGDRIILLKSNGINANGLSLARAIAEKLPKGYKTKLSNDIPYGEALLQKTNIYAKLIADLLSSGVQLHYISNITGHGLRKIMRGKPAFTYVVEKLFEPSPLFLFMQEKAGLHDEEAYGTFNMGQDYALFLPEADVKDALTTIKKHGFEGMDAGYLVNGDKRVVIEPKNITYNSASLDLR
jgi:phosphoribosylformylglycinamidine cyclo-ligase